MIDTNKRLSPVAELLSSRNIKQADVMRAINESKQNINKIWYGQVQISKKWAQKLQPVLNMPWEQIMRLGDQDYTESPSIGKDPALTIQELDVRPQAGHGADDIPLNGNGNHQVVAEWSMPSSYLRSFAQSPKDVRIVRVSGDSMEPDYPSGERVMVDTSHKIPSPPGIYVLWDGFGLILKRLEIIYGSQPPVLRIKSINPSYETYERPLDDVVINGRVIGKWTWK